MKTFQKLGAICALGLLAANADLTTVGVYDPTTPTATGFVNDIDIDHTGGLITTGGLGYESNLISLADFKTAVNAAWLAGNGGVVDFEGAADDPAGVILLGQSGTLTSSFSGGGDINVYYDDSDPLIPADKTDRYATSGIHGLSIDQSHDVYAFAEADKVTTFGLTVIERSYKNYNIAPIVTFSDSTSITLDAFSINDTSGNFNDDTFIGFQADAGKYGY